MRTDPSPSGRQPERPASLFRWIPIAWLLSAALPLPVLAEPSPSAASSPAAMAAAKPYSAYLGADFSIEWQGKLRPVLDVQGSNFVVDVQGRRTAIRAGSNLAIKIDRALKVTPAGVVVTNFEAKRAYTAARDPNRWYGIAASNVGGAMGAADIQEGNLNRVLTQAGLGTYAQAPAILGGGTAPITPGAVEAATKASQDAYTAEESAFSSMNDLYSRAGSDRMQDSYDAFSLTFDISSAKPMDGLYAVVMAFVEEDPGNPKAIRQWIYAQQLDSIGPKPRDFRLFRGGFPPGYKLVGVQLHLYRNGTELDSTVAPRRVAISAEDAFQFSVGDYVARHHGATLPAVAADANRPHLNQTYYLRVSKNGTPVGAFADQACTERVPESGLAAALLAIRFYPALQAGKPVDSVAAMGP